MDTSRSVHDLSAYSRLHNLVDVDAAGPQLDEVLHLLSGLGAGTLGTQLELRTRQTTSADVAEVWVYTQYLEGLSCRPPSRVPQQLQRSLPGNGHTGVGKRPPTCTSGARMSPVLFGLSRHRVLVECAG